MKRWKPKSLLYIIYLTILTFHISRILTYLGLLRTPESFLSSYSNCLWLSELKCGETGIFVGLEMELICLAVQNLSLLEIALHLRHFSLENHSHKIVHRNEKMVANESQLLFHFFFRLVIYAYVHGEFLSLKVDPSIKSAFQFFWERRNCIKFCYRYSFLFLFLSSLVSWF